MMKNKKRKGRRAQGQKEQTAKLDSASETPPYDAIQLNAKGSCTIDGSRGSTAILNVCSYNVRTLQTEDDLDRLIDEVEQIEWDITGLCETYRKGEGLLEIRAGYWMYEIGKIEDNPDAKGLAFLIHPKIKHCVTDFKTYSNRVIRMEIHLLGKDSVTVINAYAPTSSVEDEKVEQFYDDIEREMADSRYKIITGDFNAKTGTKTN